MNKLICELYNLTDGLDENCDLYHSEYHAVSNEFSRLMDQVENATSHQFHETLYDAVMEYLILEQHRAFQLGLRLGLQLHTL